MIKKQHLDDTKSTLLTLLPSCLFVNHGDK